MTQYRAAGLIDTAPPNSRSAVRRRIAMSLVLREARPEDAEPCGRICYAAFCKISGDHNFPPDFPNVETAIGLLSMMIAHPGFYVVVAARDGEIVGSNAMDERS